MAERTAARRALAQEAQRLARGLHHDPHGVLGAHPGDGGVVVRAFHPDARTVELLRAGAAPLAMTPCGSGLFEARVAGARLPLEYRLRFGFAGGGAWERDDPYRFTPVPGELDLHLVNEGKHFELWHVLGARELEHQGARGVAFAVWAPNAAGVSVVGDFCGWDERLLPLRSLGASGVWELFVPGLASGARYKLVVRDRAGRAHWKADPLARYAESAPGTASRVFTSTFAWSDAAWLRARAPPPTPRARRSRSTRCTSARGRAGGATSARATASSRRASSRTRRAWASRTSSCCRWPSTPSRAPGATRSRATTRRARASATPTTCARSSTRVTPKGSA